MVSEGGARNMPGKYKCEECGMKFRLLGPLRDHTKYHSKYKYRRKKQK